MDGRGVRVVEYIYDAWGKLISTTGTLATTLGADNPFRYRGYYYDAETGLYYLTTRYYDPEVCRFISADVYMSTCQGVLGGNMWAYCLNNPVAMVDSNGQETNWNTLFGGIELLLVAAVGFASVATVLSGGCAAPLLVLTIAAMTASAATISAACGTAEVVEAFTDHNFIRDDILKGDTERYEKTKNTSRTIAMMGSAGLNAYSPVCFVEGTLVQTNDGLKPIESISPDMLVYASDPETGKIESHKVVQTFVNETDELTYISLSNGEEIVTTPTHPFYAPAYGWTAAIDLRAGDILVTVNGERIVIEQVKHELLESPITVYNFEVEDLHTYFVGSCGVLVHNACQPGSYEIKFASGKNYVGKGDAARMNTSGRRIARKYNDKIVEKVWEPASSVKTAFVQEYIKQLTRGVNNSNTYNKIWSPGRKILYSLFK